MDEARPVTYGEFPELFEGFPPDAPVDLDDRETWNAIYTRGEREAARRRGTRAADVPTRHG